MNQSALGIAPQGFNKVAIVNNTKQIVVGVVDIDFHCNHELLRSKVRGHICERPPCDFVSSVAQTHYSHGTKMCSLILATTSQSPRIDIEIRDIIGLSDLREQILKVYNAYLN